MSTDNAGLTDRWRLARVVGPLLLLVFQVGGTFGASHSQPDATSPDALAVLLVIAGPLALVAVRRWPRIVLGFITAITFVYLARGYAYGPVFASFVVAVVVNIVLGHRAAAWWSLVAALVLSGVTRASLRDEPWSWTWTFGVLAWSFLIVALGELVRVRRQSAAEARRARTEEARRQAGEERLRIARELHDVVAHHMSLINVQAGVALHLVDRKPEQVETALATIKDASKEAMNELRSLISVLRADHEEAPRMPVATLDSLDDLVARTAQAGVTVDVAAAGDLAVIPAAVQFAAFRIIQEAITNVVRHSGGSAARISLTVTPDALDVSIEDNGRGMVVASSSPESNGIRGMAERAHALGGTLRVVAGSAGGVAVRARLPWGDGT